MLTVLDLGYRLALTLLMLVTRPGRVAVVYGSPDYDENGLLLALELGRRYDGRVILLCADPARATRANRAPSSPRKRPSSDCVPAAEVSRTPSAG